MDERFDSPLPAATGAPAGTVLDPRFHLAAIVDSSSDPIISKDLEGNIITWNPAAARLFGYNADEMVGKSILKLIPRELHAEETEILRKIRAGQRIDHFETIRVRKDGERIPVSVTISPINDDAGRVIGASKIARDISDQRKADETRFRLAAIVDSADDAIISKDLNGIVKTWNHGACRMYGYTAEEIVGQSILRLIPDDLQHEEVDILREIRAGKRIEHFETARLSKSGQRIHVSVTISPIKDERDKVIGASKIARDISDRKRLERLLIESEKLAANSRMAASIAHEINNPLESLMNLIYLARHNSDPKGKAHGYLVTAEEELERVSHIARQTLGYYRDTGSPVPLFLGDLLRNVLTVYNAKIVASGISTETDFGDSREVVVRKGEMLQVFSNVIANAIDAMRTGGFLRVCTKLLAGKSGEGIEVSVADSGTGIESRHLGKIFEPFFTTKEDVGTGIGLWVARQLVEKRGGEIVVMSSTEVPNRGTVMKIFIPFAAPGEGTDHSNGYAG